MIHWYLLFGIIAGALWYVTGGRLGVPRVESVVDFLRREAQRSPPLPAPLPPGLERGADGVARTQKIRAELRWRRVPMAGSDVQLWEAWRAGGPLPASPQLLVTARGVLGGSGPVYAMLGDWRPYRTELRDRWVLFEPLVQSRESMGVAAAAAATAARRALEASAPPLTAADVITLAGGKDANRA